MIQIDFYLLLVEAIRRPNFKIHHLVIGMGDIFVCKTNINAIQRQ